MQNPYNFSPIRSFVPRITQIAFIAGLILGILLGWLFSGIVSTVLRFGLLALLIIPLIVAVVFWWRVRQAAQSGSGTTIVTWSSGNVPNAEELFGRSEYTSRETDANVIDLDELRRERKS